MNFRPEKDFRETYFEKVIGRIESEEFIERHRVGKNSQHFTRKRKITVIHLIVLITSGLTRSIQRELNSFYQKLQGADFSIQEVTKSAFTHARAKLKPEAFQELNRVGIESFYQEAPFLKWNGFRLLAIDGSTLVLPKHKSTEKEFGVTGYGPHAEVPKSLARISMLFDVLNFTTVDAQISPLAIGERELAQRHLACIRPETDLVLMDRGYPSFDLLHDLQQKDVDYCIRWREEWWKDVSEMLETGETDKVITLKKRMGFTWMPPEIIYNEIICRIVIVDLPNGEKEVLITSLLDQQAYSYDSFVTLYQKRWNIEEGYKFYKSRLQLEAFSGKTSLAIKQDFYAKVFMMTTMAVMAFPIEEKLKREYEQSTRKHPYKVNRTNAASLVKEYTKNIFVNKMIGAAILAFDKIIKATTEIVRPNRKNPRKKTPKRPPSMNYKQL